MEIQSLAKTANLTEGPLTFVRPSYSVEPEKGSILDYWQAIRRRNMALAGFAIIGLGLGVGGTLLQSPTYLAKTSIEIQDAKDDDMAAKILNPQPELTMGDAQTDIQTDMKILESRSLIERALGKANISSLEQLNSPLPADGLKVPSTPTKDRDRLIEKVSKNLKVTAVTGTRLVEVSYEAKSPDLAAQFANLVASEFIQQNLEGRLEMNHKTSQWLTSQLSEARSTLQHSEDALQAYARSKGLIYTGDRQNVSEDKLRELQTGLLSAQADRVAKQAKFEVAKSAALDTVPEALNDTNLRAMEVNLTDLRKQEAEMSVTFKPDYVKAKRLRAEIESLSSVIEEKRALIVRRLDNELQESARREALLTTAYNRQTHQVSNDSENSIQYDVLKHDVDTNRQIYQVMLQRVKESNITSALKAATVQVIDPAKAPSHPYKPNMPLNAAAGLLAGLMLGIVGVIVLSKADGTIQEPGEAESLLGIPELGLIPSASADASRFLGLPSPFGTKQVTASEKGKLNIPRRSTLVTDSFRAVVASILFVGARQRQRVLVVTSASPNEGKTNTAANLAIAFANLGRKVLLIDGDTRNPHIHDIFGMDNSAGLTTALRKANVNDKMPEAFIREASVPNLSVLTSGPAIQDGADLIFSSSVSDLIVRYRAKYDVVLIDTPPMMVMPDARILGSFADGVVLVASAGKTSRTALAAAHRRFVEDRTSVLGVILNNWNAKNSAHNHYGAYKPTVTEQGLVKATQIKAIPA